MGEYLYLLFLRKQLIPEDLCSALYEGIIKRLKAYRNKHPEVKKVSRAFVHKCANWVAKTLTKKLKLKIDREQTTIEMIKSEVSIISPGSKNEINKMYEKKICRAVAEIVAQKDFKLRYILFYVLYHAYDCRMVFLVTLLKIAGIKTKENIRRIKKVRRHMAKTAGVRRDNFIASLQKKFTHVFHMQTIFDTITDPEEQNRQKTLIENEQSQQREIFDSLAKVKVVPSYDFLAELLNKPRSSLKYGVRKAETAIRDKVGASR